MTEQEIDKMAHETYELGIKMNNVFANGRDNKGFMLLAIKACISGLVDIEKTFTLMPVIDFSGEYFKSLRIEKGWTLRQTEDATGISNSYLSQFENGKINKPSQSVVNKLLNWYNEGIRVESDAIGTNHISKI